MWKRISLLATVCVSLTPSMSGCGAEAMAPLPPVDGDLSSSTPSTLPTHPHGQGRWRVEDSGAPDLLVAVGGTSATDVWATGGNAIVHRELDGKWHAQRDTRARYTTLLALSPGEVLVGGAAYDRAGETGLLARVSASDGSVTTVASFPAPLTALWGNARAYCAAHLLGVACTRDGGAHFSTVALPGATAWGVGDELYAARPRWIRNPNEIAHSTDGGASWSADVVAHGEAGILLGNVWLRSPDEVWVTFLSASGGVLHGTAGSWRALPVPTTRRGAVFGLWGGARGELYLAGDGGKLARTVDGGDHFIDEAIPTTADLRAVWGAAADEVFVVGDRGTIVHGSPR